jgi:hypothetical protein
MTVENGVRIVAGTMILISIALVLLVGRWWLALTAFVGVNLIQSAFTGFCPAEMILQRILPGSSSAQASGKKAKA